MQAFRVVLVALVLISGATSFLGMAQSSASAPNGGDYEPLEGMMFIPAGTFEMGDSFNEGCPDELPVHTVTVSAYFMGRYEITNDEMQEVLQWAYENDR
ncbi:SUMF1/EgtB/PvdO family nonheme iron enzyme, partial [Candidatus Bipolaricaulota bacterium]|nr:SUMF1/EgtB/PvdO family nonheme iron enzyme [Candidatus Bipolaricaulota bacterium]